MLEDLRAQLDAALTSLDNHKGVLAEAKAKIEAELARVPTLDDVKALLARIT